MSKEMNYHYGTNIQGSQWIKKYGAIYSKTIPNWKTTTYSKLFQEHCNCIGIVSTTKPLDDEIIKKYDLIKLNETQNNLVDSFINFRIEVESLNEMTPKEALRGILLQALFINPNTKIKEEINNKMFALREIVEKALNSLEETNFNYHNALAFCEASKEEKQELYKQIKQLEKENQWLKELIKEYKRLKELANQVIEKFQIGKKNLTEENEKYKKVITWLKNTFEITLDSKVRISDGTDCIQAFPIDLKTNEVIYDLLKEMLENV